MRFLTAFFATQSEREVLLTGSSRMQERPIGVLVDALKKLGADIVYENQEGFPPLYELKAKHYLADMLPCPQTSAANTFRLYC